MSSPLTTSPLTPSPLTPGSLTTGPLTPGPFWSDAEDAQALDDMMYADRSLTATRPWCAGVTDETAKAAATAVIERMGTSDDVTVVDYGSGSGMASLFLAYALDRLGVDKGWVTNHLHLIVVDLPGPWFVAPDRLRGHCPKLSVGLLRLDGGPVRSLEEVTGRHEVDLVMASMVVHLIPPRALPKALSGIRAALKPDGRFLWTSPDSAPRLAGSVLFHDVNRAIRERFCQIKRHDDVDLSALDPDEDRELRAIVDAADEPTDATDLIARRQIPDPSSDVALIEGHLARDFSGSARQFTTQITDDDFVRIATIPSNLKNLHEAQAGWPRSRLAYLLVRSVLPQIHRDCGTTGAAVPLTLTSGDHRPGGSEEA